MIGLSAVEGGGAISLEPGGQFELSGAPLPDVHATAHELSQHLDAVRQAADPLGIGFLTLGMSPKWTREETPVMPKSRYRIMKGYMPKVGSLGLDMMLRTATVQVNLDFSSEADMVTKMRVGLALQPVATPLVCQLALHRRQAERLPVAPLRDLARHRPRPHRHAALRLRRGLRLRGLCGLALDMPMYFVKRGETYHDVSGASFRDLMEGRLAALPGERATVSDWANHASTAFPEVRLKRFLEMRGADVGDANMIAAQAAFWAGLYYDAGALDGAWQLVRELGEGRSARPCGPRRRGAASTRRPASGPCASWPATRWRCGTGLKARARRDAQGRDETLYLAPLQAIAASRSRAEDLLALYDGPWNRSVDPAFGACAF